MRRKRFKSWVRRIRTGISLMEVLISIGVVSIGLLGVVSLIPVASQQAESGARNDRMASNGRRSFREFNVRGYANAGTGPNSNWIGYLDDMGSSEMRYRVFEPTGLSQQPFLIDPRYVAAQREASGSPSFLATNRQEQFLFGRPLVPGLLPKIPVLSLQATLGPTMIMSPEQAEEVFVFQDDLEFEPPAKNGDPPTQIFLNSGAKRYAKGQFSWFMTVVPADSGWWKLSTVICFQRNNLVYDSDIGGPPTIAYGTILAAIPNETPTPTSGIFTQGLGGGDMRIFWTRDMSSGEPRTGDWLLLGLNEPGPDGSPGTVDDVPRFEWYRVAISSPVDANNLQDLSLSGVDWNAIVPTDTDADGEPDSNVPVLTSVMWFPEVVSVYTKPVRIRNE